MSYSLLKGKRGLIFGALNEKSIGWKIAEKAYEEGASFVLTNTPVSLRMGQINELAEKCNTIVIPADATKVGDLDNLVEKATQHLDGNFDFVLHSIGMSPNVRKGRTYDDLDYNLLSQTLDISAISLHKILQICRKRDAINEWGSVVALTYVAAQRT
jgi:enoyl-[acyl-carrier protein] reductase I